VAPAPRSTFSLAAPPPSTSSAPGRSSPGSPRTPVRLAAITRRLGPDRVAVPARGISGRFVPVGLVGANLTIPPPELVGWWDHGAAVSAQTGTTLLAGHVNLDGVPGVFARLYEVGAGEDIVTTDSAGHARHWAVTAVQTVAKADLPQSLFDARGPRRLVLVTCTGRLLRTASGARTYDSNLVVTALPSR
jgi:hypothetical protein